MNHAHSPAAIRLSNVSYYLDNTAILSPITLNACERRIGIVGRNGSGKSTLARLLCGLTAPTSGGVMIDEFDITSNRKQAINTVGMLFQNPDHQIIFPTVEEELVFGLRQLGKTKAQARDEAQALLQQFGMADWLNRSVSTLSQGKRHLICLIAVLLMKPKLIVLDEPYAGLDMPTTIQLNRYLRNVNASIVHITHQLETLHDYDRIWWIDEGKLTMDGAPSAVLPAFTQQMQILGQSNAVI